MTPRVHHVLFVLVVAPGAPAWAQAPQCSGFPAEAHVHACTCVPGPHNAPVWGSGPYTGDSDICAAALHAGVIGPEGGQVIAMNVVPPASYTGSEANGVMTSDWGSYDTAFVLLGAARTEADAGAVPLCTTVGDEAQVTCRCPADAPMGSVWGSGPYTSDSDICTAARHAGAVGTEGGEVTVLHMLGMLSYKGSTANGVTTSDWGSYGDSFDFLLP